MSSNPHWVCANELRWQMRSASVNTNPSARIIPGTNIVHVLQQKWVSTTTPGEEWRDVPCATDDLASRITAIPAAGGI